MLNKISNLNYVVLLCKDLALMKKFYNETMELPIQLDTGLWVEMRIGDVKLTLAQRGRAFEGGPIPHNAAAVQLAFKVTPPEVDGCYAQLLERNVDIIEPPTDKDLTYWQHRTLFFKDPEGNILEIASPE